MTKRTKKAPKAKRRIEVTSGEWDGDWRLKLVFGPNDERQFQSIAPFATKARAVKFATELGKLLGWPVEVEE